MRSRRGKLICAAAIFACGAIAGRIALERSVSAGPAQGCPAGDVNEDGRLDISDAVHVLRFLFQAGPPPASCACAAGAVSTAIIVRHGNRDSSPDDCPAECPDDCINADGRERAQRLATMLHDLEIDNLIGSEACRTHETLAPTAADHGGLPLAQIASGEDVAAFLLAQPAGSVSVVAHHSFTIHDILTGLGIENARDIPVSGDHYDNFLVVLIPPDGKSQLIRLHF